MDWMKKAAFVLLAGSLLAAAPLGAGSDLLGHGVVHAAPQTCEGPPKVQPAVATTGTIVPRLVPSPAEPRAGDELELAIAVDMAGCEYALGSYGAHLRWDPSVLEFLGVEGGRAPGFASPVINEIGASSGDLRFAHANPHGATGSVEVLRVRFRARGALVRPERAFDLRFTSMAATGPSFENLLPILRHEGPGGAKGDP